MTGSEMKNLSKVNFSLMKSHLSDESMNLNFVLVSHCFENMTEALKAHY